tara:strand:+ start:622 stop:933 length:312 start_codon:yes stop_codon:yes gene_type:complete
MGGGVPIEPKEITEPVVFTAKESKFLTWWKTLVYEEYHLTIWFVDGKTVDSDGNATYNRIPKKYKAVKISKISPKLIKFTNMNKQPVEIRSEEPMNWDLVKVY